MNVNVILHLVLWYGLFFVSGFIFWITFYKFFTKLYDKGYAMSKVLSLLLVSLILWTLGFLFKLPITSTTAITFWVIFNAALLGIRFYFKIPFPKISKKKIIGLEVLTISMLLISLYITAIHPYIDNVTERIMDFKLLNVLSTTSTLPAPDVWFTPKTVNYYYYGQFFFSIINKVTDTDSFMGYLFAMSFIYTLAGTVIYSLARSIKNKLSFGLLALAFALFFSNFSFIYNMTEKFLTLLTDDQKVKFFIVCFDLVVITAITYSLLFVKRKDVRTFLYIAIPTVFLHLLMIRGGEIIVLFKDFIIDPTKATLWYPDVSRVINATINEFPFYSIIIGDLHPHYVDVLIIPVLLTLLYIDFETLSTKKLARIIDKHNLEKLHTGFFSYIKVFAKRLWNNKSFKNYLLAKVLFTCVLSIAIVLNSWELITTCVLIAFKDLFLLFTAVKYTVINNIVHTKKYFMVIGIPIIIDAISVGTAFLLQTPYFRSVESPVKGIKINLINAHTDFAQFFTKNFDPLSIFKIFGNTGTGESKFAMGLDRFIIIALFLLVAFFLYNSFRKKLVSKERFAISFLLLFLSTIFINAFVGVLISYIQSNFDLSPLNEFLKVWLVFYVLFGVGVFVFIRKMLFKKLKKADYFMMTLLSSGIFLSIFTELFYVADYFDRAGYEHHRANTVFKVNYIGFVYLGIASAWTIYYLVKSVKWQRNFSDKISNYLLSALLSFFRALVFIVIFIIFLYVPYTINQWIGYFGNHDVLTVFFPPVILFALFLALFALCFLIIKNKIKVKFLKKNVHYIFLVGYIALMFFVIELVATAGMKSKEFAYDYFFSLQPNITLNTKDMSFSLDSYNATKGKYPEIFEAVEYYKSIKLPGDVILESNGDAYKLQSIFSVYTATPTVLGWWGHEAQWRESKDPTVIDTTLNDRVSEVSKVYTLGDGWEKVIKKYQIKYVFVGDTEREKQGQNVDQVFDDKACFERVFKNDKVKIFKIDYGCESLKN